MITEDHLEQLALQWFQDTGWNYTNGADLAPEGATPERVDFRTVVLEARLAAAVRQWNPKLPPAAVEEVVHVVATPTETSLPRNNRAFHRLLMDGVKVEFTNAQGEKETDHAQLVDFQNPQKNDFLVVRQFTVTGTKKPRRPDLVAFGNGQPLVEQIVANRIQSRTLATLRDTLLPKLLSGELSVDMRNLETTAK